MQFSQLVYPWIKALPLEMANLEILGIHNDSREVRQGFLFLAYPGGLVDGRFFIVDALMLGAVAIIYEPTDWPAGHTYPPKNLAVPIKNLSLQLAKIASRFYEYPTKKLRVTGITGTNGKTTIAYQLTKAHVSLGRKSAYIGTLGHGCLDKPLQRLANTTPSGLCLQQLLHNYQLNSIQEVCMEVSSHALCQKRVDSIDFKQAIFTNLSHDHLDYHHTMSAYAAAKAQLFCGNTLESAILNYDDDYHLLMRASLKKSCQMLSYGFKEGADIRGLRTHLNLTGSFVELSSPWGMQELSLNSIGMFNIYNALAIFSSLLACGYPKDRVAAIMGGLTGVPGRMELLCEDPCVLIDYAHTPDALEKVLSSLRMLKKARIILVVGCGGDRDKSKRPAMGRVSSQYADIIICTSDNPRSEDPEIIIEELAQGLKEGSIVYKISDRKLAISKALSLANKEDLILIAGKGHEDYQEIAQVRYPFSDKEVVERLTSMN